MADMANTKLNQNQLPTTATQSVTVSLTANQIKALKATPVQIVPAPGSGYFILVTKMIQKYYFGTTPFNVSGGSYMTYLYGATDAVGDTTLLHNAMDELTKSANTIMIVNDDAHVIGASLTPADVDDKALMLTQLGAGEYTTGDGTLKYEIQYVIRAIA